MNLPTTISMWAALLMLGLMVVQPSATTSSSLATSSSSSSTAASWQRDWLNRNARNFLHHRNGDPGYGNFDAIVDNQLGQGNGKRNAYNELNSIFKPYAMEHPKPLQQRQHQQQERERQLEQAEQEQANEGEIYGIVEPLIEDTPCANRPCLINDDCCPAGVCVNTYGEGKCIYIFGRQRHQCQHNGDCSSGAVCGLDGICQQPSTIPIPRYELKQPLGGECTSSSNCQVANGMCCQQQWMVHRRAMGPKWSCEYFRDPFDCIDIGQGVGMI